MLSDDRSRLGERQDEHSSRYTHCVHASFVAMIALASTLAAGPARSDWVFVECTYDQQAIIRYAYALGFGRAKAAEKRVGLTPSYERWFGTWSQARGDRVLREIRDIVSTMLIGTPKFSCLPQSAPRCVNGKLAYLKKDTSYDVSLCPAFWIIDPNEDYDMTSVLLHEIAHFEIGVGGITIDQCQGFRGLQECADLARSRPGQAVENADSYRLFIEDGGRLHGDAWGMFPPPGYR